MAPDNRYVPAPFSFCPLNLVAQPYITWVRGYFSEKEMGCNPK